MKQLIPAALINLAAAFHRELCNATVERIIEMNSPHLEQPAFASLCFVPAISFFRPATLHITPHQPPRSPIRVSPRAQLLSVEPRSPTPTSMTRPDLKLKAIFFDLDGTCVNSDHIHYETYRDTLLSLVPSFNQGKPISRQLYDSEMSGRQNPELVANILPNLPLSEQTRIWQTKEAHYEEIISRGIPPVPGLPSLLDSCAAQNLTTYIVTNAPKGSAAKTLASIGLAEHFEHRVVVAEECDFPKPHPAPYLRAMELAKVLPHHAIAFEDSPSGTRSATAAGLLTIGVRSTQSDKVLREAGAEFTIPDFTAPVLAEALKQWLS